MCFFFFNDTAPTEIYTLSLHDALPIFIRDRIKKMKERVDQVRQQRATAARGRDRRLMPTVGIVGYTNAGKSTLLNALVGSEVARAENQLFATLDPTSRQVRLGDGQTADRKSVV